MKKLSLLLLVFLVLAGCTSGTTSISNSEVIFSVGGEEVTTNQLYETMKRSDGGNQVIKDAQNILTENVELTDEMKAEAEERWEQVASIYGEEFLLSYYGYSTKEDYMDKVIYPELKMVHVLEGLVKEDMESVVKDYNPRLVKILNYSDKETADSAYQALIDGKSMSDVVSEFVPSSTTYSGSESVFLKGLDTNLPSDINTYINETTTPGLSEVKEVSVNAVPTYYIVQVLEVQADKFEDQILNAILTNKTVANKYLGLLFRNNNFQVYDESIYNALQKNYSNYFKATEE